ncbi:MAG: PAS domain S-box protein, partial [Candidatus Thermoplasmatota archaeon]|nr:PAS domain S-box protein [Candidatus Thermoplasmatota archaeon]MBU1940145.1 PAS domain S-box protein [Candidatus Thermoplasmatota archaeon]
MKDTPAIVKELREKEKQGNLLHSVQSPQRSTTAQEKITDTQQVSSLILDQTDSTINNINRFFDLETQYRTIFENYTIAITIADEQERIFSWNKYAEELLNMTEKELYLLPVKTLYPPEEWKRIRKENVRKKGIKYRMQTRLKPKDKTILDIELSLCILRGVGGKSVGSIGIIKDISELKKTERQLIESETRYRTIFENSAVAITLTDSEERIISWNNYAEHLLDMHAEDLYLKPVHELYPIDEWKKIRAENVREKGMQHHLETKIIKKDNTLLDIDISLSVIKNNEGTIVGSIGIIKDISQQKETERRINTLLKNADDEIYLIDKKFRYLLVNNAFLKLFQVTNDMVLGQTIDMIHEKPIADELKKTLSKVFQKKETHRDEYKIDNTWYLRTFSPIKDTFTNEITAVLVITRDITTRKQAEETLTKSEKKYRTIFDNSPQIIMLLDHIGTLLDANSRVYDWLGYEPLEISGQKIHQLPFLGPTEQKKVQTKFQQRSHGKNIEPYEIICTTKNGCTRIGQVHAAPIYDQQHTFTGEIVMISDITHHRHTEETLIRSEERFKLLYEKAPVPFHTLSPDGIINNVNEKWTQLMGYTPKEVIGKPIFTFIHEDEQEQAIKSFKKKLASQESYPGGNERTFITKDNKERTFVIHDFLSYTSDNKIKFIHTAMEDITEHKKVWDDLVKSEEKYRILAETSADGVFTTDTLGRLTYINPAMEKLLGRRKSQILATPFREYLADTSIYLFQQTMLDIRKHDKKLEGIDFELVHENGYIIPAEANISPLMKEGIFVGIECALRDISERKKVEQELKKSEKLRTEFMNIAAHELKSPVTPIKGYLELIECDKNATDQLKNWARIGLRNAERLLRL